MVHPASPRTIPPIQSTSGVSISHSLIALERNTYRVISFPCCRGFVVRNIYLAFELNSIILQGTKVLEDREIRHDFIWPSEDAPAQHVSPKVVKYTGTLVAPQWEDIEQGILFSFPWYFVKSAQVQEDKFEVLCHVEADLSTAPYKTKLAKTGKTRYEREGYVILLVGLTELKAQVGWTDTKTVRAYIILDTACINSTQLLCAWI